MNAATGVVLGRIWRTFAGGVVIALGVNSLPAQEAAPVAAVDYSPAPASPTAAVSPPRLEPADPSGGPAHRLREGTHLKDKLGKFRQNGESLSFIDEEGRELGGLPNLNLERVIRMLKTVEEPEGVWWSVSGTVTEFAGRNYLLVSRAVYKAATLPPAPDSIE